jgi:hypothetical protein
MRFMNLIFADPPLQTVIPPSFDRTTWQTLSDTEMTEADELLFMMEKAMQQTLRSEKLQALLNWITQVADRLEEPSHPAAKRAAALALVLERAIALSHAHARGTDRTWALERSNTLNRALVHARKIVFQLKYNPHPEVDTELQTCELSRAFTHQVTQTWFEGQFDPKLIELSQAEAQALNHYLYTNAWMVQCIGVGVGISRGAWDAIVDRLLQPAQP